MCCHLDAPCLAASHVPAQIYAKIQEGVFDVSNETFGIRVVRIMLPFLWLAVAVGCAVPRAACCVACRPRACRTHKVCVRKVGSMTRWACMARWRDPRGIMSTTSTGLRARPSLARSIRTPG